ncbi:MAG: PHP domain-containing protein [bacterium]
MLKIDLHLHTIVSGHAYTILEYINRAKELRMDIIGFSDHGPSSDDAIINETYFSTMRRLPRVVDGITILRGVEANIINEAGNIDISEKVVSRLDYVMANFHDGTPYNDLGIKRNTQAMISAIKSGKINILSHSYFNYVGKIDIKKISEEACRNNVLLEITMNTLQDYKITDEIISNIKIMLKTVKEYDKKIILSSDGHNIWEMADDAPLEKVKGIIGLTDDMIINNYPDEAMKVLGIEL